MYCVNCGQQVQDGVAFCPHCGNPISAAQQAQAKVGVTQRVGRVMDRAVSEVANRMDSVYGVTEHVDLKFGDFFSEVGKKHTHEESESIFVAGTSTTTPDIRIAAKTWHKPWFYSRVLAVLLAAYLICVLIWKLFVNPNLLPGIMVLGSFAVPVASMVFFYEANVEQNISFMDVLRDFFVGGALSLLLIHPLGTFIPGSGTGEFWPALLTGFIEETAKAAVVVLLIMKRKRPVSILNGLLIGCAVGAGFAAFESAGYAFNFLLQYGYDLMSYVIVVRGLLAIGGHVVWAAVEGAAIALASNGKPFEWPDLLKKEFLLLFAISTVCHGIWDWEPISIYTGIAFVDEILLVLIIWIVVLVLMRRGIAEVNKKARLAEQGVRA